MANLIPNENTFIGFIVGTVPKPFGVTTLAAPTAAEITGAIDLTDDLVSLTASATGNTVPTPRLKSLFETTIPGTSAATFSAEMYRDDVNDLAWDTLPRGVRGCMVVCRFGGTGVGKRPVAAQKTEVWPIIVSSRAGSPLASGAAQMFSLSCSVPQPPAESAIVAA